MSEQETTINNLFSKNPYWDISSESRESEGKLFSMISSLPNSGSDNSPKAAAMVGKKRGRENNGKKKDGVVEAGGELGDHELHIRTERERRKKMRNMFSSLHALLPQLPPKADKTTIVDEAIRYIQTLQNTFQTLQRQKLDKLTNVTIGSTGYESSVVTSQIRPSESREAFLANLGPTEILSSPVSSSTVNPTSFQTWFSPNVVLNLCGNDAQISVCSVKKPGLMTSMFYILQKHNLEVLSAHVSSNHHRSIYMIHAHAGVACEQLRGIFSVEETFKLAVGEMNLWLLSC